MKKKLIAANFKMNKTGEDIVPYFDVFLKKIDELKKSGAGNIFGDTEIVVAPPFTSLCETSWLIKPHRETIRLCAQNVYCEKCGAYTGEISVEMIKSCGCSFVIIGHSERRNIFKEDDELIGGKIKAVYDAGGVIPILCVGEKLEIREKNSQEEFVGNQLMINLKPLKEANARISSLVIAYEPVWAIGTGMPIRPQDGEDMHKFIYDFVNSYIKVDELRVIYGGSVTESNISDLMVMSHINGALVGGASLDPSKFFNLFRLSKPSGG